LRLLPSHAGRRPQRRVGGRPAPRPRDSGAGRARQRASTMCGIAGLLTSRGLAPDALEESARRMIEPIMHRGPDDGGVWADGRAGIALGFRRLAILDLSPLGHQPMRSPSGRYVAVFNGEVYNFAA